jgi:hypothetical protein
MPKFVIERNIPGAGAMTLDQMKAVTQQSCGVLRDMGPRIQWVHSYVTADKVYCIYIAPDEQTIREHASLSGIPADSVCRIAAIIDPATSD